MSLSIADPSCYQPAHQTPGNGIFCQTFVKLPGISGIALTERCDTTGQVAGWKRAEDFHLVNLFSCPLALNGHGSRTTVLSDNSSNLRFVAPVGQCQMVGEGPWPRDRS